MLPQPITLDPCGFQELRNSSPAFAAFPTHFAPQGRTALRRQEDRVKPSSGNLTGRFLRQFVLGLAASCFLASAQAGTVTITMNMGNVLDEHGANIATTSLFQLVNLGANGVFDPISTGAWIGGDDTVIDAAFPNGDGWTSAAAFDLTNGTGIPGQLTRQFTFALGAGINPGDKIGIRWFPTVTAASYVTTTPSAGMPYGQFTRQSAPLYGGSVWVVPAAGSFVSFDPLVAVSYDLGTGKDPNSAGVASMVVLTPIEIWRQTFFGSPANAGNGANTFDFAHDGQVNLVKYAFGLNPTQSNSKRLPGPKLIGGSLGFNFTEPTGVSGVTYGAEWSTTLQSNDWHPIPDTGSGTQHNFSVPTGNNTRMFIRHRITSP